MSAFSLERVVDGRDFAFRLRFDVASHEVGQADELACQGIAINIHDAAEEVSDG